METGELRGLDGYEICAIIEYSNAHQPTCAVVVHNHWDTYIVFRVDGRNANDTMERQFGWCVEKYGYGATMESVEVAYEKALKRSVGCALGHESDE